MPTPFNDNSVLGNSSNKDSKQVLLGRVTKIIMGPLTKKGKIDPDFANQGGWGAVGSIKFSLFQDTDNPSTEIKSNNFAKPLFSNFKNYPLRGEIVAIIAGPSTDMNEQASAQEFYYISTYNLWNSQHHNAFPDPTLYARLKANTTTNAERAAGGKGSTAGVDTTYPIGDYFKQKSKVNTIQPFEGDVIIEGRYGQAIRFGSTVTEQKTYNNWSSTGSTGDPITIITNRRADTKGPQGWIPSVENINTDGTSIWMSSGQAVKIDVSNYPLDTFRLGFQAQYTPDTVLPLLDISPGIQNIASAEYDKRVLDNVSENNKSRPASSQTTQQNSD